MYARAHSEPWLAHSNHLRLSSRTVQNILRANVFVFILLISNHTVFLIQFGINLHVWVFLKAEIALAEAARAISAFWKSHSCNSKLIPNWTRNRMITYTKIFITVSMYLAHRANWGDTYYRVNWGHLQRYFFSSYFQVTASLENPSRVLKWKISYEANFHQWPGQPKRLYMHFHPPQSHPRNTHRPLSICRGTGYILTKNN